MALYLQPTRGFNHRHAGQPHAVSVYPAGHDARCALVLELPKLQERYSRYHGFPGSGDEDRGLAARVVSTATGASRLGISMAADVDNAALYNAFRTAPDFSDFIPGRTSTASCWNIMPPTPGAAARNLFALTSRTTRRHRTAPARLPALSGASAALHQSLNRFRLRHFSFACRRLFARRAVQAIAIRKNARPASGCTTQFQGSTLAFRAALGSTVTAYCRRRG